ncbi:MAG: SWIM zinc finger family protein [Deltaproteobacteria bacterium]|nr:SWIM zinc finger family protein [Deltaproteobacteria bacterium]
MGYWGGYYPPYVSVAEKKAKAAKKLKQLKKKNPGIKPVSIEGSAIASSWWGKSWNQNLERYADYSNRIGRGRSYVRHGAVLDLQIDSGKVEALVQGTRAKPYFVTVKIKAINEKIWQEIKTACGGKLDSLQELLEGKFPEAFSNIFMEQGTGLFPSPKEIEFSCSCPDSAYMCKHVAATLYGIGTRLDEDPSLFFKLRKVRMKDLVTEAVEDKTRKLLEKAKKKTERIIVESDLADMFGIDMEEPVVPIKKSSKVTKKSVKKKKSPVRVPEKTKAKSATGKSGKKTAAKQAVPKKKLNLYLIRL